MTSLEEQVARAIDAVQVWSRFNDWTRDRVEGYPVEILLRVPDDEPEVVLKRFPPYISEQEALYQVASEMRARAAIAVCAEEMANPPTEAVDAALRSADFSVDARTRKMMKRAIAAAIRSMGERG